MVLLKVFLTLVWLISVGLLAAIGGIRIDGLPMGRWTSVLISPIVAMFLGVLFVVAGAFFSAPLFIWGLHLSP